MLIIGSRAGALLIEGFRTPKDWDIVASADEIDRIIDRLSQRITNITTSSDGKKINFKIDKTIFVEIEISNFIESATLLLEMKHENKADFFGFEANVAAPHLLYLIKKSHIRRAIHWQKNIADLHFLKAYAKEPNEAEMIFYEKRKDETHARGSAKEPSLAMSNSDFFRQKYVPVELVNPHDAYHWAVAYGERPVFYDMKHDTSKAWCEKDMFDAFPLERRLQCVREETMVIALERFLIPGLTKDSDEAYTKALERVMTTLTGGWFREFAIENWPNLKTPDRDFVALWEEKKEWAIARAA